MSLELIFKTPDELAELIGEHFRVARLLCNLEQRTLAAQAGVSVHAVQNLEGGKGVSLTTLLRVAKALKRLDWIETIAPQVLTNPLTLPKHSLKRQRASQDKIERFKTEKIRPSLADQECFAQALLSPTKPAPALERAFARRSKLLRTE